MESRKVALLIGSPYGGLRGTQNDVETMKITLSRQGFSCTLCCGSLATRHNILQCCEQMIANLRPGDAVIWYYSGHGGIVKSKEDSRQFIVPIDYEENASVFTGILDIEMSEIFSRMTAVTKNVTIILDCCHSGRMARSSHSKAKFLSVKFHDLNKHYQRTQQQEGNADTVRIVAADQNESAYEHEDSQGQWHGALTRALAGALGTKLSWHTLLIQLRSMVFGQHPQVEGPSNRLQFSLVEQSIDAYPVKQISQDSLTIDAGRAVGLCEGDILALMHDEKEVARAEVISADAFQSSATFVGGSGAVADYVVVKERALRSMPIRLGSSSEELLDRVQKSKLLTVSSMQNVPIILRDGAWYELVNEDRVVATQQDQAAIIRDAEQLVQSQLLRSLRPEPYEKLDHCMDVSFGIVKNGRKQREVIDAFDKERACIWLKNAGHATLWVNIFDINAAGRVTVVNGAHWPEGVLVEASSTYIYGRSRSGNLVGESLSWPVGVPVSEGVEELLFFIISDAPADLRHLNTNNHRRGVPKSGLEKLLQQLVSGGHRDFGGCAFDASIRFNVAELHFTLHPELLSPQTLRSPESSDAWKKLSEEWPEITDAKSISSLLRAARGIPPCIWIVNKHAEEIDVVVSKFKPSRLWTGMSLNGSATGAGVSISSEKYILPASKKTLKPGEKATFPLWNRAQGSAVVSVFTGDEKKLFIDNDQVAIGGTATFTGAPDFEVQAFTRA